MNKNMVKHVGVTVLGVVLAGFLLQQLRGNSIADQARAGFN